MQRPKWLTRETERWESEGAITPEQRQAILESYSEQDEQLTSRTLVWLAWLVAGCGLVLLVFWNWTLIDSRYKAGGAAAIALALFGGAWYSDRTGADRRAEMLAFGGALATGAVIAAMTELFALPASSTRPLLMWALAIAVTAVIAASPITTALGAVVLLIWALVDAGAPPASWTFLLVFPFLAVAAERRTEAYAAAGVTTALGVWVVLVGLDTWRSAFTPGVMALVAGGALDAWAHLPEGRRPAFASVTPALALVVFGLGFLGAAALEGAGPPAIWGDTALVLPAIALAGALTAVTFWPSAAEKAPNWRSLMFGGLIVAWVVSALVAGGPAPAPVWWTWTWTVLPSIALVVVAISAVREGVTGKNLALFVVGVAAIIALVVMHFSGEVHRSGRSAAALFVAAAALWWVSRTRVKPRPEAPAP